MCLSSNFWSGKPRKSGYASYWRTKGIRDQVSVEGDVVRYLLWGNEVATWNRKTNTLIVDDCGWQTNLTTSRLNGILYEVAMSVYSVRGKWFIQDRSMNQGRSYVWERKHTIDLDTHRITPCTPRKFNIKASKALKRFHEKGRELVEKKKFLTTMTLEGVVYAFVDKWYKRIMRPVLILLVNEDDFETYKGMVATTKIYSAFLKNNATILSDYLMKYGSKIQRAEGVLYELKDFGVDVNTLPEHVVSSLALAKLLEE